MGCLGRGGARRGHRVEGHNIVAQYSRRRGDADGSGADRLRDAGLGLPNDMVPASATSSAASSSGDDVYKRVKVLRRRAHAPMVARMPLRPSNTLLLRAHQPPRPDWKEVLSTRSSITAARSSLPRTITWVERLARRSSRSAAARRRLPGTYKEFWHWSIHKGGKARRGGTGRRGGGKAQTASASGSRERGAKPPSNGGPRASEKSGAPRESKKRRDSEAQSAPLHAHEQKKRTDADTRRREKAIKARRARLDDLETRIARCENAIRDIELTMSAPGFYEDRAAAQPVVDRHQALMWEVGDLMHQWEELQAASDLATASEG
jgi:hypothetical protein